MATKAVWKPGTTSVIRYGYRRPKNVGLLNSLAELLGGNVGAGN